MKKPEITPGPWNIRQFDNKGMSIIRDEGESHIATVHRKYQSNAKAISAVPEMLDDLLATYNLLKGMRGFAGKYDEDIEYGIESIKKTLKKAGYTDEDF